jgi:hypothetical protein
MKRSSLALALAAVLLLPTAGVGHHVEFPSELEEYLELLPGGVVATPAGPQAGLH